ncbi:MAG TPA: peptidylprolyl isomerase [Blastocatellia bacterium]|nr:peptidylprolyl isomerase [Blastocatellia bacterium]
MRFKTAPNRLIKTAVLTVIILSLGFILAALRQDRSNTTASAGTGPETIATVEGKQISAKTYRMYLRNGIEALGLSESSEEGRRRVEMLKASIIAELIDRTLIEAEAERRNVSIPEEIFSTAYNRRVAEMGGQEFYRDYLTEHSITDEDFRRIVRQEILGELMQKELTAAIAVTAEEARAFYDKEGSNPNLAPLFRDPARAHASHILVSARRSQIAAEFRAKGMTKTEADRAAAEEMARRRARAAAILQKARGGHDFAALARAHSEDTGTAERGGDLGLFTRNTHTARFDDAVFALKPGQISGIVETEYGYHIIKLAERKAERTRGFDEVRAEIARQILARKQAETLTQWLERRRREADVQVDPFYR